MAEYINRDAALDIVNGWREQLIPTYGKNDEYVKCLETVAEHLETLPAADVAERKPMAEDVEEFVARLRDFAVDLRKAEDALLVRDAADAIAELSEERKTGKWRRYSPLTDTFECDQCGYQVIDKEFRTNFCPNCGCAMEVPTDV